ncbi:MAG: hypothetical protein QNL24_15285 [Akkermansiaceae bacterium]|jgi:hypothetical protein|tara:strand:+ start:1120 stop:2034 length:915 start_codon:yes stop_codon:yes gene_type:complete
MENFFSLIVLTLIGAVVASESPPIVGVENINKRLDAYENIFSERSENPDLEDFNVLSIFAGYAYLNLQPPFTEEQNARIEGLKNAYRSKVMTQPGHAKLTAQILRSRSVSTDHQSTFQWKLRNQEPTQLEILKFIKSHEAVSEIASFLRDRRGEKGFSRLKNQKIESTPSFGFWAAYALWQMEFENPPDIPMNGHVLHYLKEPEKFTGPWLEWWQEIENGERTFSFKGDSQVFDVSGPLKSNSLPPSRGKREPLPSIGGKPIVDTPAKEEKWAPILYSLAALLFLIAVAILIKSRLTKSGKHTI